MSASCMKFNGSYSPVIAATELHYHQVGLLDVTADPLKNAEFVSPQWRNERVARLCNMRGCSFHELGMFFLVPPKEMDLYLARDRWPASLCLHFQTLESSLQSKLEVILPPDVFTNPPHQVCPGCGTKLRRVRGKARS